MATLSDEIAPPVFTVGHSNRAVDAFCDLLAAHGIERLVDVRRFPRSRHNPQFDRDALAAALAGRGVEYAHRPGLGGRRGVRAGSINQGWRNPGFRGYADYMQGELFGHEIAALADAAARRRNAVMCAEAVPWRCHRWLIADALLIRGRSVRHILSPQRTDAHRLTAFAEVDGTGIRYPFALTANDETEP